MHFKKSQEGWTFEHGIGHQKNFFGDITYTVLKLSAGFLEKISRNGYFDVLFFLSKSKILVPMLPLKLSLLSKLASPRRAALRAPPPSRRWASVGGGRGRTASFARRGGAVSRLRGGCAALAAGGVEREREREGRSRSVGRGRRRGRRARRWGATAGFSQKRKKKTLASTHCNMLS